MFVVFVNIIILLCITFDWCWWEDREGVRIGFCIGYLLCFLHSNMYHEHEGLGLFVDFDKRLECWKDYYTSPEFVYHPPPSKRDDNKIVRWVNQIDYAPIRNGDFVLLSNDKFLKVNKEVVFSGKDIDFNSLYNTSIELTDITGKEVYYSFRHTDYGTAYVLDKLNEKLKEDGLSIIRIYNSYGDTRWEKFDIKTSPSKVRKYLYEVIFWGVRLIYIAIVLMPIVSVIATTNITSSDMDFDY